MRRSTDRYLAAPLSGGVLDLWAGLRPVPADGLPICGALPGFTNAFVATGHAMLGVTLAPATGKALAELILTGHGSELLEPFSPARFTTARHR
jgi:D-amino-acid dehydrogenase